MTNYRVVPIIELKNYETNSKPKIVPGSAILVDNNQLREVDQQRYLGIIFNKRLLWNSQVSDVCKRVAYYLHLLSVHHKSLTFSVLKLIIINRVIDLFQIDVCIDCVGSTFKERPNYSNTENAK